MSTRPTTPNRRCDNEHGTVIRRAIGRRTQRKRGRPAQPSAAAEAHQQHSRRWDLGAAASSAARCRLAVADYRCDEEV